MDSYTGADGIVRKPAEHVAYLTRCADQWRSLKSYAVDPKERKTTEAGHKAHADRIDARAREIAVEHGLTLNDIKSAKRI